jgi:glycosyltransferase
MKVSIITCTYNSAATLMYNLESVFRQEYKNIEQIIIDNQSTDDTLKIAKEYTQVKQIVSEPDGGIYDAMNKGIARATGDIIGILNSDDYLAGPDVIGSIVKKFRKKNCEATYGNLIYVKKKHPEKIHRVWISGNFKPAHFYRGWMMPHPTFYVSKEVYKKYGVFDTSFNYSADYEIILRFLLKYKIRIYYINQVLIYMRAGGSGNRNLGRRVEVHAEDHRAWVTNQLQPKWYTLKLKPIRKINQFLVHYFHISWLVHIPPTHNNDSFLKRVINVKGKIVYLKNNQDNRDL